MGQLVPTEWGPALVASLGLAVFLAALSRARSREGRGGSTWRPMVQSEQSFRAFGAWLRRQATRDDEVGELARGFLRDRCAEHLLTVADLDSHLTTVHQADAATLAARRRAWDQFTADIAAGRWALPAEAHSGPARRPRRLFARNTR